MNHHFSALKGQFNQKLNISKRVPIQLPFQGVPGRFSAGTDVVRTCFELPFQGGFGRGLVGMDGAHACD